MPLKPRAGVLVALVVVAATVGSGWSGQARAAADDEDALIRRGLELRKAGDDHSALIVLQRAYQIARSPRAAAQLGFAEQALGRWTQAEVHVSEALRADSDPWIRKNRAVVEEALQTIRAHVGRIEIAGGQPGAQVLVNGVPVGAMPLPTAIPVNAGPVDVEMRAPGHLPALKTVNVAAGEYARVPFTLQRLGGPRAPAPVAAAPPAPVSPPVATAPPAPTPQPPSAVLAAPGIAPATEPGIPDADVEGDPGRGGRRAGVGLMVGGVAMIGLGVGGSLIGKSKFDAIHEDAAANRPYDEGNGNWQTYETAAAVAYVVGAAALVGGAIMYANGLSRRREVTTAGSARARVWHPVVAPRRGGAGLSVRF
jgi:hypothetical protein